MYIEFWLKATAGFAAGVFLLLFAFRRPERTEKKCALDRLKPVFFLAVLFTAGSFLLSRNGMLVKIMEFDPGLPVWLVICAIRLSVIAYFSHRASSLGEGTYRRLHLSLLAFLFVSMQLIEIILVMPAAPFLDNEKVDKYGVVMQTRMVTCVPVALANVCRLYGDSIGEYEATRLVKTMMIGSLIGHSVAGCKNLGFSEAAYTKASFKEMIVEDLPFLITINSGFKNVEHAVAVVGCSEGKVFLADPWLGFCRIPQERFSKIGINGIIRLGRRSSSKRIPTLSGFKIESLKTESQEY